jgi:hypothetical protein
MQRWVAVSFSLRHRAHHRTITRRIVEYGSKFWHVVNVARPDDLDAAFCDRLPRRAAGHGDDDPDETVIRAREREVAHQAEQWVVSGRPEHGAVEDAQRMGRQHVVDPQVPWRRVGEVRSIEGGVSAVGEVGAALAFRRLDGTLTRRRHRRVHPWVLE